MNPKGHIETLQARHPGNRNAERHGAYSRDRGMSKRAEAISRGLYSAVPHLGPVHQPLVEELARLLDHVERLDLELKDAGFGGKGDSRWELRCRLSGRVERLATRLGLTPDAQVRWAATLYQAESLDDALADQRRKREALNG